MATDSMTGIRKPQPGEVILGKYALQRVLGAGGMGTVFAAQHLELERTVAVKFLHTGFDNPEVAARFMREARAAVRIESEHVAKVIDVGRLDDQTPFIVMEYLEGEDLSQLLERGQVAVPDAVDYVVQACSAMVEAHHLGIVHRDLKPANLFLTRRRDGSPVVKVLDFGISKWNEPDSSRGMLTNPTEFLGSPVYMSPEQLKSALSVDLRTDVWSLGVILFELLAGRPAFEAPSLAMLMASILHEAPPDLCELRPDVPPELAAVVAQCLVKERERRLQNVGELVHALLPFAPHRSHWNIERISRASGFKTTDLSARSAPATTPPAVNTTPPMRDVTVSPWVGEAGGATAQRRNARRGILLAAAAVGLGVAATLVVVSQTASQDPSAASVTVPAAASPAAQDTPIVHEQTPSSASSSDAHNGVHVSPAGGDATAQPSLSPAPVAAVAPDPSADLPGGNVETQPRAPVQTKRPPPPSAASPKPSGTPAERPVRPRPGNPLDMDLK